MTLPQLPSWDLETFKSLAFTTGLPGKLPRQASLPPASSKWFKHKYAQTNQPQSFSDLINNDIQPESSELRTSFWSDHETTMVPLELTSTSSPRSSTSSTTPPIPSNFTRTNVPLKILLTYLTQPTAPDGHTPLSQTHSIYLAQCSLTSLPKSLQSDLPIPTLVTNAGKGDIYESSLWLGRPPTYTPFHRDPNPNILLQIAGKKVVRILPPHIGTPIFEEVQERLSLRNRNDTTSRQTSARFRGEEMMAGPERELLHSVIWAEGKQEDEDDDLRSMVNQCVLETHLGMGEGLFIPDGWWHSVKGVGEGVTASVNWWFR